MAVNSTHPLYKANLPAWSRARDVLAGEDAMKAAGDRYLPRLDSQSDVEYGAYTARASFFGATALTLEGYLDLIFRRAPMSSLPNPERLRGFVEDCDRWGTTFVRYARRVVSETLSVGRAGSLVLQDPPSPGGYGAAGSVSGRPWVSLWPAEQILNWSVGRVGERTALAEVVLQDGERIRVLRLVDSSCVREVWRRIAEPLAEDAGGASTPSAEAGGATGAPTQEGSGGTGPGSREGFPLRQTSGGQAGGAIEDWVLEERVTVRRDGVPLPFVPFVFHGPRHSEPEPDKLPLADIIAANLDHYRLDADYKHGLHFTAPPTAWVSGFDKATPPRIGSSTAWMSELPNASAGFLEFSGAGLAHLERAMEKVERRMSVLGARMLESAGVPANAIPAAGVPASNGGHGDLCGLGSIVASLNESLSRVLQLARWWVEGGEAASAAPISFAMNTDLNARRMTAEEMTAVMAMWRGGGMSRDTMLDLLKRGEILPDGRTVAQELALIHKS